MRNAHLKYQCYPSVVCVGKETEVTVFPRDISRRFRDDREYELVVVGLREDQLDYHAHVALDHPCTVQDGCLKFTYLFDREQEYSIRFAEKGGSEVKISLYAVKEDLYGLRPLKGDLHSHTFYSDGQDGIAMTPADYREEGFDFVSITDHNRMYPSQLAAELYKDIPLGLHLMTGEEVHTPGSLVHIVHAGGKESVCDRYIRNRETYNAEVAEIAKGLSHVPEQYRERVAMAHWACQKIHEAGGLAIYAHPFWCPNRYNVSEELGDLMFEEKIFDAFELVGGAPVNPQLAIWQEYALRGNRLPVVGSSDSHDHDYAKRKSFARRFTVVFAKENTTEAILDAIRGGYSLAAEIPADSDSDIHFYGAPLRLVLFAKFIWENYFNETWRLCLGEGILMRRYAEGEEVGDLLAAMQPTVENFYKRFYGLVPAPVVSEARKAFLDHCLEVQRNVGPITKGSNLYIYGGNERRE
ncbi:MAG: PHP domain-containing protein [Clostridia bacterium]|nr:PHP domain-containing protein [Clostridia bacterium]